MNCAAITPKSVMFSQMTNEKKQFACNYAWTQWAITGTICVKQLRFIHCLNTKCPTVMFYVSFEWQPS